MNILKLFISLISIITVLFFAIILWLGSNNGQRYIHNLINNTPFSPDVKLAINKLSIGFFSCNIQNLTLTRKDILLLDANNINFRLLPQHLIKQKISVTVDVDELTLSPISNFDNIFNKDKNSTKLPYDIEIKEFDIHHVHYLENNLKNFDLSLGGSIYLSKDQEEAKFNLKTYINHPEDKLFNKLSSHIIGNYYPLKKEIKINNFLLISPILEAKGHSTININDKTIEGIIDAESFNLINLNPNLNGKLNSVISFNNFNSTINLTGNNKGTAAYNNSQPFDLTSKFNLEYNIDKNIGRLNLQAEDHLNSSLLIKKSNNIVELTNIKIQNNEHNLIKGDVTINLVNKHLKSILDFKVNNLHKISSTLSGEYSGSLNINSDKNNNYNFTTDLIINNSFQKQKEAINIKSSGRFKENAPSHYLMDIDKLNIKYNNIIINNIKPINISHNNNIINFTIPKLEVNNVFLIASGKLENQHINININTNHSAAALSSLLPYGYNLTGEIIGKLGITGTKEKPIFNGTLNLKSGSFTERRTGIQINDINIISQINNGIIVFKECNFSDTKNNRSKCYGQFNFSDPTFPYDFNINSNGFYILAPAIGLQSLIKADLVLNGNITSSKITGNIINNLTKVTIPSHFHSDIPTLNIKEDQADNNTKNPSPPYPISVDINVLVNNRLFVTGWGLDAELTGKLKISNPQNKFGVFGTLNTLHGKYQEFGRLFQISKGDLIFDGKIPPYPYIDVIGTFAHETTQINLQLNGPLLKPNLSIYSNSDLTQEELLSIILFGNQHKNISLFQAYNLAASLSHLAGHSTPDQGLLSRIRKMLRIDDISVTSNDNKSQPSLGIGKHLSNKLYLKIEKGAEDGTGKTIIEYELLPNLSIEGEIGEEGNGAIGFNWKKDF